jgi:hypothetical protein
VSTERAVHAADGSQRTRAVEGDWAPRELRLGADPWVASAGRYLQPGWGEHVVMASGPRVLGGRYELRGVLGSGGMGVVHDGWDTRLHRPVAVKELRPELAGQREVRRRFEAEARAAATLSHPHVVAVHDTGEDAGVPWIVMERLPGPSLAELLKGGPLPQAQVRAVLAGVLGALALAHDHGIMHRDIKPANVLLSAGGVVKVTDFGIAKSADATEHTVAGMVLGTVAYLSPARLLGAPATVADDLWATGVLGWECLLGRRPVQGDNLLALARAIADHPAPPVLALAPGVDPVLARVVDRLLAREPGLRYPDARAVLAALGTAVTADTLTQPVTRVLPLPAPLPAPVPGLGTRMLVHPGGRPVFRRAWLVVAGVAAALVLGAVVLVSNGGSAAPPTEPVGTTPGAPVTSQPVPTAPSTAPNPTTATTAPTPAPTPAPSAGNGKDNGKPGKGNG